MARILLLLCAINASAQVGAFASSRRHETVSGRIVAYSTALACINGNGYWAMIIHVLKPKEPGMEFIRVDFSLPCEESPKWISAKPSVQKFRLIRNKESDGILRKFIGTEDLTTGKKTGQDLSLPIWRHMPATEKEKLPFGQRLRGYQSVDMPLLPVF